MKLLQRLADRQLIVVTGKGGVGKSTLTATLGRALARAGRSVLLVEIDPRESLYPLLSVAPSGGEVVQAGELLFLQNLQPRAVLDRLVCEQFKVELLVRRVLDSPVYQHFVEGAPGLKELAVLGHALRVLRGLEPAGGPRIDLVILDAPASGHGISMLEAPGLVSDVIHDGPFGRMARELREFVTDPDRCAVVIATIAEEMPVQETIELTASLDEHLSIRPEGIVVNRLYPALDDPDSPESPGPAVELWRQRRGVNDRELARLGRSWSGPRVDLPYLPLDRGSELVAELSRYLDS